MSEQKLMGFGSYVSDEDKSLTVTSGGVLGLNKGVVTKFEYNPLAGAGKTAGDAIDVAVLVDEKTFMIRIFPVSKIFSKDALGNKIELTPTSPEYVDKFNKAMNQLIGTITHIAKAVGITEEQLKQVIATNPATFADYAKLVTALKPVDYATRPVDVFLQYQYKIGAGNEKTYLEMPNNMMSGKFLVPHLVPKGAWKEVKDSEGLKYTDDENNVHIFSRPKSFLTSPNATQQDIKTPTTATSAPGLTPKGGTVNAGW